MEGVGTGSLQVLAHWKAKVPLVEQRAITNIVYKTKLVWS